MKLPLWALFLVGGSLAAAARGATTLSAVSPDGRNAITIRAADAGSEGADLVYSVTRDGRTLIERSPLGPRLVRGGDLSAGARIVQSQQANLDSHFLLPWGKCREVHESGRAVEIELETRTGLRWKVVLRAFNDGVAFRYIVPAPSGVENVEIREEMTEFDVAGDPTAWVSAYDNFTSSHEAPFERTSLANVAAEKLIEAPLLLTWRNGPAAAIAEARVRRFAGMYLQRRADTPSTLRARLSPLPARPDVCVAGAAPVESPWRVVLLADRAGELLESNLLLCLNDPPPADLGDFAWARPGKSSFHWWNGEFEDLHKQPNSGQELGRHKEYIDFCAKNRIAYHAVTGDGRPWYVQKDPIYAPPQTDADILTPRPDLRLPEILDYARQKGVGIRLWVHWKSLVGRVDEAFARYESWGVRGLMVDFLDRDDQEMIEFSDEVLESAARHHLHIQFHGSPKFSGEARTFPHLFNREGVMNLEYLKWSDKVTPQHNVNVAYTRALAGPVDYHLGGFRSVARSEFKPHNVMPTVLGTRCHHLALYVAYENPMPMVGDAPGAYEGQPGFDFLVDVPTTWDETRFVAGEPGEYVVVARRSGKTWYLGGVTNWSPRQFDVPLRSFGAGALAVRHYADGSMDESRPNEVVIDDRLVEASESLAVKLAPGGGFVATIHPAAGWAK